jgi:hypothetical protein
MLMSKKGLVVGVVITVLLVSYPIFSTPINRRVDTFLSGYGLLMTLGLIVGGILSGFIIEYYLGAGSVKVGRTWGGIIGSMLDLTTSL